MSVIFQHISGNSYTQKLIKDRNSTLLFELVRKYEPLSRADLVRMSGLSPATVTVLVGELLENHWIQELPTKPQTSGRGRKPVMLETHAEVGYVAVIEILSHGYLCTLYDICHHKIDQFRCRDRAPQAADMCRRLNELVQPYELHRLLGVHVRYPGLFDERSGELGFSTVIAPGDMIRGNLINQLKEDFPGRHVILSNNVTAMAYAVFVRHAAEAPLLAISIQEGVSAGVVIERHACLPVEAGHIIISNTGPTCQCGNRGCLEALCSTTALLEEIDRRTNLQLEFSRIYCAECNHTAMEQVALAFSQGDEDVNRVLKDYAYNLCAGIVSIANLFAIRSVYLGGSVAVLGEPFLELVRKTLKEHFRILTGVENVTVNLFEDDLETNREAAVMLSVEQMFRRD